MAKEVKMGRWFYTWRIEYYGCGGFLHRKFVEAKDRDDAIKKLTQMGDRVIEIKCCERAYKW